MFKLFFILSIFYSSLFAIINISPNEVGLRPGVSGYVQAAVNNQRGNTYKDEYNLASRISYDNNKSYVTWIDFNYAYGTAQGIENENKAYAHYRFLHTMYTEDWNWELFVQNEGDDFRKIQRRLLGGTGVRWRFLNSQAFGRIYLGVGGYYEYLNYTTPSVNPVEHNSRMNLYIAYTKKFGKDARVSLASYYQPKMNAIADYYTYSGVSLLFYVYGAIYLKMEVHYTSDSMPAIGVKRDDFQHKASIGWKFGAKSNR